MRTGAPKGASGLGGGMVGERMGAFSLPGDVWLVLLKTGGIGLCYI